jgi:hypothetical protein
MMSPSRKILVGTVGFFQLIVKVINVQSLINSKFMLKDFSLIKSSVFNLIGTVNTALSNILQQKGITHKLSSPHTH